MDGCDDALWDTISEVADDRTGVPIIGEQLDGCDDSLLDNVPEIEENRSALGDSNKEHCTPINIINTNARSLCPKIDSLIDLSLIHI